MIETIVKVASDTASPPDQQQFRRAAGQQLEQQPKKTNSSKSNVFHTGKSCSAFQAYTSAALHINSPAPRQKHVSRKLCSFPCSGHGQPSTRVNPCSSLQTLLLSLHSYKDVQAETCLRADVPHCAPPCNIQCNKVTFLQHSYHHLFCPHGRFESTGRAVYHARFVSKLLCRLSQLN